MRRTFGFLLLALLVLVGCSPRTVSPPVADLTRLVQDAGAYHGLAPDVPLLTVKVQQAAAKRFLTAHFAPWERNEPGYPASEAFWGLTTYANKDLYGENTLRRSTAWLDEMRRQCRVDEYPSLNRRAIAVANTAMRVLPTAHPAFFDFSLAGEGYPFDYMQNSLVLAGTPLHATHLSADRAWVLVESRFAFGWVPVRDVAWVDKTVMDAFRSGAYAAVVRDGLSILDREGLYRFTGYVGTLLPVARREGEVNICLIPVRDRQGNAVLEEAILSDQSVRPWPLPATPANFAKVANVMLGRQYGWGGLYENRDCSALTMDLMAAFGIYLPRNSSQQVKKGTYVPLDGMPRKDKKRFIAATATPFLSLIRKPGHIMLYIGQQDGDPVVLHAAWGLKTKRSGLYGRKVIGRAVITTLEPGIELPDLARPDGLYIEAVSGMTTLPGPEIRP
ncbi:glycoside hydrolase [Pseudodesulfovibrio cashew]|uniref:Glycoside hydrolase n=1 Tax=Pseudodesulfovibrio cashew TaxID=2678688 RepID=A0A6I6JF00_9BACT|nr:NlpC/P60 family N-terminal domain-containing protein [Pseudodesulfovibrio cashew]QGY39660.1 glycoside hydrolase [Pseudodesulfovibrio cashew]